MPYCIVEQKEYLAKLGTRIKEVVTISRTKNCGSWLSQDMVFFVDGLPPTPLDADANDPLFEALVEPVVQPNTAANAPAIYRCPHCCLHSSSGNP